MDRVQCSGFETAERALHRLEAEAAALEIEEDEDGSG
jgi:hypothetical protein